MVTKGSKGQFTYQKGSETCSVDVSQIGYLESTGRKVKVVTQTGMDEFYGTLSDVCKRLDTEVFWQIHQSIVINSRMVQKWNYETVIMKTEETLPISQSRRKVIKTRVQLLKRGC